MRALLLLLLPILVAGCATMDRDQCRDADWYRIGRLDGVAGHGSERLMQHAEACGRYGVIPDEALWRQGQADGLQAFCRPDNAYGFGRGGGSYRHTCPPELEPAFLDAYREGRRIYQLEQRGKELEREIAKLESEIKDWEKVLLRDAVKTEERTRAYREIQRLEERRDGLRRELHQLRRELR
jgi:hypothetical protein